MGSPCHGQAFHVVTGCTAWPSKGDMVLRSRQPRTAAVVVLALSSGEVAGSWARGWGQPGTATSLEGIRQAERLWSVCLPSDQPRCPMSLSILVPVSETRTSDRDHLPTVGITDQLWHRPFEPGRLQ